MIEEYKEVEQQDPNATPRLLVKGKRSPLKDAATKPKTNPKLQRYLDNEGWRIDPYVDSKGYVTGGIGHLFTEEDFKNWDTSWSEDEKIAYWTKAFEADTRSAKLQAIKDSKKFKVTPSDKQIEVMAELKFNMGGTKFNATKWPSFYEAMSTGDVNAAADELLLNSDGSGPSKWLKDVGSRATNIAEELRKS
jgi:GH24 family phage-related lysozyme (muramidase)